MTDKPWVDVGTLAIARLAIGRCIPTFIDHLSDRTAFRLRWICHLDQYGMPGMDHLWEKQIQEIIEASQLFDSFVLIANRSHVGYGGSFFRILREVKHSHLFYTDDDQLFIKDISITEALDKGLDYWSWHNGKGGSTTPGLWSKRLVDYYIAHYPSRHVGVTERCLHAMFPEHLTHSFDPKRWEGLEHPRAPWPSQNIGVPLSRRTGAKLRFAPHRTYVDEQGNICRVGRHNSLEEAGRQPDAL